ncbi:MAG: EVE domain-containing protein [Acidimicrobiales bacterium]|nr:EVE domain-containing protein [Acidimicrobiales bacterium]
MTAASTKDGRPIAGWVFKANRSVYDVESALEAEGWVNGWSVHENYRVDLLAAGQPCFLYVSGKHPDGRDGGFIIGVGEIAGEAFSATGSGDQFWGDPDVAKTKHRFVSMEVYPLVNPIPREDIVDHPILGQTELIRSPQMSNPSVLRPDELDALREFDLAVDYCGPDPILGVFGGPSGRFLIDFDEDREEPWSVMTFDEEDNEEPLGTFESFVDAVHSITDDLTAVGEAAQVAFPDHGKKDGDSSGEVVVDPVAVISWSEDVNFTVIKTDASTFAVFQIDEPEQWVEDPIDVFKDLGAGLLALAHQLELDEEEVDA